MNKKLFTLVLFALPGCLVAQQMSGMNMQQPDNSTATKGSQSLHDSEQQQTIQRGVVPAPRSDAGSTTHDTMILQEPEDPDHHTGRHMPVPELLRDVAKRAPMSLEDFESIAERTNPTLAQARADVLRAQQQGRQAALYPNPSIGYSGEHIRGGSYGAGEQGAYIQQKIVLGGKLGLRRDIYAQEAQANKIGTDEQLYRVHAGVEQAFYMALVSQAEVRVRQQLLQLALEQTGTTHQLANIGQADAPDILQSEVEAEQAQVDFVIAQRQYLSDFSALAALAGAQQLLPATLKGDLENLPLLNTDQQVASIIADSPPVKRAQQEVAIAAARLKDAHREPVPDLTLRAGEWYSGEDLGSSGTPAGPMSFASANIELPLWNRNQGNIEAARAELERAKEEVTRTQLSLKHDAEPLAQAYLDAHTQADTYRTSLLPRARRAYELYLMKYQQMAAAYPQVLISQRTLFQLQIGYLHSLSQVWQDSIALKNYTLTGGLMQPDAIGSTTTDINLPNGGSQ